MSAHHDSLTARMRTVEYALTNPYSSLYRDLYGFAEPPASLSEAEWEQLPILTKERLVATPFHERLFSPLSDVDYVRTTSGTSGKNLLIVPKTRLHPKSLFAYEGEVEGGLLTFLQPQHQWGNDYKAHGFDIPALAGDPANLLACTRLAFEAGVDVLRTFPFIMERHLPHLVATGLAEQLRVVIIAGERITIEDVRRYAQHFPNAKMIIYYAANELQGIPGVVEITQEDTEILYEPGDTYHWELIDGDGNVVREDNVEGEITLTTLWTDHNNLPLVRYATGDVAMRRHTKDGIRYLVLGRKHTDRIKLPKGELRVEEVERALRVILGMIVPFELHYHKRGDTKPKMVIKLMAGTTHEDPALLAARLKDEIKISTTDAYALLMDEGLHMPLEVALVPSFGEATAKKKYFHVHEEA